LVYKKARIILTLVAIAVYVTTAFFILTEPSYTQSTETTNTNPMNITTITTITTTSTPNQIMNRSTTTVTETIFISTTITKVLIHTTTFTSFITISTGVSFDQAMVFVTIIGVIAIVVGYFLGYKTSRTRVEEVSRKPLPRKR
jgi:hypothetical protein